MGYLPKTCLRQVSSSLVENLQPVVHLYLWLRNVLMDFPFSQVREFLFRAYSATSSSKFASAPVDEADDAGGVKSGGLTY
jgi:hypothetical protein